jgi:hypothetical protein
MFLYVFFFSNFAGFNNFLDEEIVIFIAIGLVSFFFLKLNLLELNAGINSRISLIEADFKKNYKFAIENLIAVESTFQKSRNLILSVQKNFNFFFTEYISFKFNEFEGRFFKELILLPQISFLKNDFILFIDNRKNYKISILQKSFSSWNQKNLFKANFLLKNWL